MFQEEFLKRFPNAQNYAKMYEVARKYNIEFPLHGKIHSPVADILNYSGYIFVKLLDVKADLEKLAESCGDITVEELQKKQENLLDFLDTGDPNPEDLAEELHIPMAAAVKICESVPKENVPRIIRKDDKLCYFLPADINKPENVSSDGEMIYRFEMTSSPQVLRYKYVWNKKCWHLNVGEATVDLSKWCKVTVNGETTEFAPIYLFEGKGEKIVK